MKTIACFKVSDGQIFEDEKKARKYQENLIGEMLDGLIPYDDRGHMTRIDRFNLLVKMMEDAKLVDKINALAFALNYSKDED